MSDSYGGADIDTSSLVNADQLAQQYDKQSRPEELCCVVGDSHDTGTQYRHDRGEDKADNAKKREVQRRIRSSAHFYDSIDSHRPETTKLRAQQKLKQSRQLPPWIWRLVIRVLGIRQSRPFLATSLYILTLATALLFCIIGILFTIFDISSKNTKTTAHIGFISLLIGFGWLSLGIYSFRLAGRLFENPDFAASIRTHSRTLFKISSAVLLVICGVGFTVLNLYNGFGIFDGSYCDNLNLYEFLCPAMYVTRTLFSVIAMVWNLLVGCMLLSVCRTHTIGIRRFARDLEEDGQIYEAYWKEKLRRSRVGEYNQDTASILNNSDWFVLTENHFTDNDLVDPNSNLGNKDEIEVKGHEGPEEDDNVFSMGGNNPARSASESQAPTQTRGSTLANWSPDEELPELPPIMTEDELLLCYWKISNRMHLTSQCLQRWLASWMSFVIIWCADYVIYWLSHSPNILGIMEFVAPMLLLLLMCSAYAEANGEGQLMIKCICPTKERYALLSFLGKQPLQMQVFAMSISYQAILTVVLAFSVAFSSRLILDEVMKV